MANGDSVIDAATSVPDALFEVEAFGDYFKSSVYHEISMCTIVHTREDVQTWIGFAELAKGSVLPMKNRD